MMYRTHIAFSVLVGLLSLEFFDITNPFLYFFIVIMSSMIADIDIPQSKIGRKAGVVSWLIEKLFGHRGVLHSLYPVVVIYILFFWVFEWHLIGLGVIVGYLSHIFIDLFNKEGIVLLPPFRWSRVRGFITSGGIVDYVLFILLIVADIIIMGWYV